MAILTGTKSGTKISRYEHFLRVPDLQTVFQLELIYGVPARNLFPGIFEDARSVVARQAAIAGKGTDALASFIRNTSFESKILLNPSAGRPAKPTTQLS